MSGVSRTFVSSVLAACLVLQVDRISAGGPATHGRVALRQDDSPSASNAAVDWKWSDSPVAILSPRSAVSMLYGVERSAWSPAGRRETMAPGGERSNPVRHVAEFRVEMSHELGCVRTQRPRLAACRRRRDRGQQDRLIPGPPYPYPTYVSPRFPRDNRTPARGG